LEGVTAVKCLDAEGHVAISLRRTPGLNLWESVGMLTAALDVSREDLADSFVIEDDEE
jgi:hypothetical protein